MSLAIVTTTINSPTEATKMLVQLAINNGYYFIVVGDTKTPHSHYEELFDSQLYSRDKLIYLHPDKQEALYPEISQLLGWKTIQRRNIGFLYALEHLMSGWIYTVDDDNIPYYDKLNHWLKLCSGISHPLSLNVDMWKTQESVFDPLAATNHDDLWHRGFPLSLLKTKNHITFEKPEYLNSIKVIAGLWDGDPDIDAITRITKKPLVSLKTKSGDSYSFARNKGRTVAPFNSQNTILHKSCFKYYCVLPGVGRMDDIWGAYLLQKFDPDAEIIFTPPTVYQERNQQCLVKNLENELLGYKYTESVISCDTINHLDFIPQQTKDFYQAYYDKVTQILKHNSSF